MIKHLRLHNFKTFLNFEIDLTRRHLLIGKNNTGKTNFCDALAFLGQSSGRQCSESVPRGGLGWFQHRGYEGSPVELRVLCDLPDWGLYQYDLSVEVTGQSATPGGPLPGIQVTSERLALLTNGREQTCLLQSDGTRYHVRADTDADAIHQQQVFDFARESALPAPIDWTVLAKLFDPQQHRRALAFKLFLQSISYYSFSPQLMRLGGTYGAMLQAAGNRGALSPFGENLSQVLFYLKNEDEPSYRHVLRLVSLLEPDIDSFNFWVTPENKPIPYVILKGGDRAGWENLSDGTLRLLALAVVLAQAGTRESVLKIPSCAIIEEPENGLYCGLLRDVWEELETLAPKSQFIFTSHSPYVIDLFDRDLESVTSFRKEGRVTNAKPLSAFRDTIEHELGEFSLGELHYKEVFG